MKVRVYQPPNAPAIVEWPNQRHRQPGESEEAFFARVLAHVAAMHPERAGWPFADLEARDLPTERTRLEAEDVVDLRAGWRLVSGHVVVSPDHVVRRRTTR